MYDRSFQMPASGSGLKKRWANRLIPVWMAMLAAPAAAVVVHDGAGLSAAAAAADEWLNQPGYAATGWVEIHEGGSRFRGTGVLLQNNWVLTAAHSWDAALLTGLTFHHAGTPYAAVAGSWIQHPGWMASPEVGLGQGWDLALFKLAVPVAGTPPATLHAGFSELGAMVTFFGAGSAGTGSAGPRLNPAPLFYAGTNIIDRVIGLDGPHGAGGLLAFDFDDGTAARNTLAGGAVYDVSGQSLSAVPGAAILGQSSATALTALEGTSAAGDSGGPVFADFGSGPELVGLLSWGVNPSQPSNLYGSLYGDVAYLTRLSASRDWILTVVPEPAHAALVLAVAGLLRMRRRRQPFP
jgi:hypothetical protein